MMTIFYLVLGVIVGIFFGKIYYSPNPPDNHTNTGWESYNGEDDED